MAAAGVSAIIDGPDLLEAGEPPEARGLRRDEVKLLVSMVDRDQIEHARFLDLPRFLSPGDVLVVNTSGTLNAAIPASDEDGQRFELHLSTKLPGGFWTVEVRQPGATASLPFQRARAATVFDLPAGGRITLLAPYPFPASLTTPSRLWIAALELPRPLAGYLERHGMPIRYAYVKSSWPGEMYQTIFATDPGSAEMPSAGRPFTETLVTRLVSHGIQIAPLLLHTGVSSLEKHEPPFEEFFRVPPETAELVNAARLRGRRVIAVGTTVVRALETVTDERGLVSPGEGWTDLVIDGSRALHAVTGMITGFHQTGASHLALIKAAIGPTGGEGHLARAYAEARALGYLCHEFGDAHLIVESERAGQRPRNPSIK